MTTRAAIGGLLAVVVAAWAYLLTGAGMGMHEMDGMLMPMHMGAWTPEYTLVVFVMWSVMMAAMMLPSAVPMILFHNTISRKNSNPAAASGGFVSGYIAVWIVFSAAAVALQIGLDTSGLLSPMMQTTGAIAGFALIAAGLYQWTPLKQACLRRCRSPIEFFMTHWRKGIRGAFVMGLQHGGYCLGCCWMLMLLLFVGGVMNVVWIAGLSAFVLVEKLLPKGGWTSRIAGAVLILWGAATLRVYAV